ncbi:MULTISPECIES: WbuC family cupin fold metalloprotein [unclassified Lentimicrobium]|uniref:WbuC family cupin fold metalloprotein n=1 Tax=unclassified Lentimicrobium TaxID=2677434 RepID=UPI001551F132|nr:MULTISPECIES: WbuC family cupin fold metalloprotein [unclassified Lentimicrobium]NPD47877.1 WbuC family cupin fold metalloprotein [Lentimicrobium sp. S6]NPD83540.1 WbuC family cupin fold metalloprotein [Lentimicrobium sp. L6]NPD85971.1 WbuC family cupin fold metalloprotein [Lentimicrobium sp. L6]
MIKIDRKLLDRLTESAKNSERKRMNYNFHPQLDDPIQRLLNALEPETYLPPHRHQDPDKEEVFLVLRGKLVLIEFDDDGSVLSHMIIEPQNGTYGGEVACGVWHTLISLESGTVIYEVKKGPFAPISRDNFASWAPLDSSLKAKQYQEELLKSIGILR